MVTCINLLNFSSNNDVTLASQYIFEHIKIKSLLKFELLAQQNIGLNFDSGDLKMTTKQQKTSSFFNYR